MQSPSTNFLVSATTWASVATIIASFRYVADLDETLADPINAFLPKTNTLA